MKEADNAIYARRLSSIEQEKSVKESELETEKAIQKKEQDLEESRLEAQRLRKIQQFKINQEDITAQIEDEKQLEELVSIHSANEQARGDAQAYKIKVQMQAYCYQQCKNDPLQQLKSDPVQLTLVLLDKHHDFKRRVHENKSLSQARGVTTRHC